MPTGLVSRGRHSYQAAIESYAMTSSELTHVEGSFGGLVASNNSHAGLKCCRLGPLHAVWAASTSPFLLGLFTFLVVNNEE